MSFFSTAVILCVVYSCNSNKTEAFISSQYLNKKPFAEIINMPVHSDVEQSFVIDENTKIQIYAVGELVYNLANAKRKYYLKGDDLELSFGAHHKSPEIINFKLSWGDGDGNKGTVYFKKNGLEFWGNQFTNDRSSLYQIEVRIPWSVFGVKGAHNLDFDVAIGDNDDDYKQEGKIAWSRQNDLPSNFSSMSRIILDTTKFKDPGLISVKNSPIMDGIKDKLWNGCPTVFINNVVMGVVRDQRDLSAYVKSCWDEKFMYLYLEIQDSNRKVLSKEKIKEQQTFADYGWIEDKYGNVIWQMHVLNSTHAGGAQKNQKISANLEIGPGMYKLRYISDESHSYENWDDDAPETSFYGIKIYK